MPIKPLLMTLLALLLAASPVLAAGGKEMPFLRRGLEYVEVKDFQRAVRAFAQAVRHNPDCLEAQRGLGMAYLQLASGETAGHLDMVDHAIAAFSEVLRLAPQSAEVLYQRGLAHLAVHAPQSALRDYRALKPLDAELADRLQVRITAYQPPKAQKSLAPGDKEGKSTPISLAGNQVLVPVSLTHDGKTVEASLLLDTGASSTLISRDLARRLNLDIDRAAPARFQVVGGGQLQGWHTRVDKLDVGPVSQTGMDVAVVAESGPFPFDGLLGMNFLKNLSYSIDFSNQLIYWAR